MPQKDDRRLVVCERCKQTYPGYQRETGELSVVGGPACPNCNSSSFAEIGFDQSSTLSCPNCGTKHRETLEFPDETTDVVTTSHAPDGIVEVTCAHCSAEFYIGYKNVT